MKQFEVFFFQAEDGIRDSSVTGVQTCALPIVIFSGIAGVKRNVMPVWLGWSGSLIGIIGALVYVMDFWGSTATGRASQPMQRPMMRYGVGLPLQLWMLGVGVVLLMDYFSRPMAMKVTHAPARPAGERPVRRAGEGQVSHPTPHAAPPPPTPPAAAQGGFTVGVPHP